MDSLYFQQLREQIKRNGGYVFPFQDGSTFIHHGMTLRDYFAGQALAGMLASSANAACAPASFADDAYLAADAMLQARSKSDE